jgi:hypothetical protein
MKTLLLYELLEQQTLRLDAEEDQDFSERLRELMDFIWYERLTQEDRNALNARSVVEREEWTQVAATIFIEPAKLAKGTILQPLGMRELPYVKEVA